MVQFAVQDLSPCKQPNVGRSRKQDYSDLISETNQNVNMSRTAMARSQQTHFLFLINYFLQVTLEELFFC